MSVAVRVVERPTIVLGSTQAPDVVDHAVAERRGVAVTRRRSGGGAVLLVPGRTLWVDVELGRADPRWDHDVQRSFHWLGRAWAEALVSVGSARPEAVDVHDGPLVSGPWSRLVCFAGLGPGEVRVGGAKVVGIAQRRTRTAATFGCLVHAQWDPFELLELLALDEGARADAARAVSGVAAGVDPTSWPGLTAALRATVAAG